jgi:hypothetical protein
MSRRPIEWGGEVIASLVETENGRRYLVPPIVFDKDGNVIFGLFDVYGGQWSSRFDDRTFAALISYLPVTTSAAWPGTMGRESAVSSTFVQFLRERAR